MQQEKPQPLTAYVTLPRMHIDPLQQTLNFVTIMRTETECVPILNKLETEKAFT